MTDYGNVPYDLEMVNLGSTFSKFGFDYQYLKKRGFNFAAAPQPLKTDYEVLEKYQDHIKEGAIIAIVVCLFGFARYEYEMKKETVLQNCINLTKCLIKKTIGEERIQKYRQHAIKKLSVSEITKINALQRVNAWKAEFSLNDTITKEPTPELEEAFNKTRGILEKVLSLCKSRNFRPVIITMPALEEENRQFSDEFINYFHRNNIRLVDTEGVPVLDYFRDNRFNNIGLYENYVDCLNDKGRELFAEVLIQDLKSCGLWED